MPIPASAPIEGYPNPSGDRHVLVLDSSNCFFLYEMFDSVANSDGSWNADSAAVWDFAQRRTAPLDLDLGRCRRAAHLPWTSPLGRSCVWRNQACVKVHVAEQQGRDDSSGIT